MQKVFIISFFLVQFITITKAQTFTVSGYVTDKETRETLIGVSVMVKETKQGVSTDNNGYYTILNLKSGTYTFQYSYLGYKRFERLVQVHDKSILLNETPLLSSSIKLQDVTVVSTRRDSVGDSNFETSQLKMSANMIKNIPAAHGDIFKAIKYLPGIEATDQSSPLYSVRGADPSGNLVLLDGVTVYNPYHFATADGLFNTQTVKDIDLFVGGFGAEYGGRNASILYISTKDGNMDKLHGEIEPTTTHTKVFLEFPVGKNGSMTVAGRYYYDLFSRFILGGDSYFYDANISYTHRINDKNRLTIKLFDSKDKTNYNIDRYFSYLAKSFSNDNTIDMEMYKGIEMTNINSWTNKIATAYLKTIISPNIYLKTQVYGSFHSADMYSGMNYRVQFDSTSSPIQMSSHSKFSSKIADVCLKSALTIKTDTINSFHLGFEMNHYSFSNSAEIQQISSGPSKRNPALFACFAEDKMHVGSFTVRPGLRVSRYTYFNKWQLEPRLNLTLDLPSDVKLKAAWGIYYQYIISMNTQEYQMSQLLDYYYPLKNSAPTQSIHYIVGLEKNIGRNSIFSANVYYMDMPLTYMFNLNQNDLQANTFSDKLEKGTGKSYGIELMWKGQYKKLSGWMSYGLSKSTRSYPFIMNGKPFLFDYDRTHSFKAVLSYKITEDLTYNGSLVLQTGLPKTIETTVQPYFYYDPVSSSISGGYPYGVENGKNNARLPMSLDLDLGVIKRIRSGFGADLVEFLKADASYFSLSISNVSFLYRNVLYYYPLNTLIGNGYTPTKYTPVGINYLPVVSAGYVIKF